MPASVSVVITTYNSAATLESCLNSIVAVDYRPLDVIIVDNASSDATRDILRRFEPRFRVSTTARMWGSAVRRTRRSGRPRETGCSR